MNKSPEYCLIGLGEATKALGAERNAIRHSPISQLGFGRSVAQEFPQIAKPRRKGLRIPDYRWNGFSIPQKLKRVLLG
jgi:hypothetical protein